MKVERAQFGYHLVLESGEDIEGAFLDLAREVHLPSCHILGLGSVSRLVLGHYDPVAGQMLERQFLDTMELTSFVGNLTWLDGQPLLHAHAVAADRDLRVVGGHFLGGRVSVTGEFALLVDQARIERQRPEGTPYGLIVSFL